jgi:hypothetical protein
VWGGGVVCVYVYVCVCGGRHARAYMCVWGVCMCVGWGWGGGWGVVAHLWTFHCDHCAVVVEAADFVRGMACHALHVGIMGGRNEEGREMGGGNWGRWGKGGGEGSYRGTQMRQSRSGARCTMGPTTTCEP